VVRSGSNVVGRGLAGNVGRGLAGYLPEHDQQRCYCHAPTVKPGAGNVVVSS
jgi:hypothetical protein